MVQDILNQTIGCTHIMRLQIYGENIPFIIYNSIVSVIPREWKQIVYTNEDVDNTEYANRYEELADYSKVTRFVYDRMITQPNLADHLLSFWSRYCIITKEELYNAFNQIYSSTKITKYRSFQFRVLHYAVLLNNRLYYLKIASDKLCYFCHNYVEEYQHFFWECVHVQNFWKKVVDYISDNLTVNISLSFKRVTLNLIETPSYCASHCIILIALQWIF